MSDPTFLQDVDARGIARITLNRPEVHNAFDDALIAGLTAAFAALGGRDDVRAVVLASNGKSFSAGGDLGWMKRMADYTEQENLDDAMALAGLMKTINDLPKPVLGLVQGAAYGGGVGLVACCDIAIASDKASFCLSEVKLGLAPAAISPYVVRAIGAQAARRYFLTAERFDATEAHRLGLVDEIAAPDGLEEAGERMIGYLLAAGPAALAASKVLTRRVEHGAIDEAMMMATAKVIADLRASPEGQEGLAAFFEKRKPNWIRD